VHAVCSPRETVAQNWLRGKYQASPFTGAVICTGSHNRQDGLNHCLCYLRGVTQPSGWAQNHCLLSARGHTTVTMGSITASAICEGSHNRLDGINHCLCNLQGVTQMSGWAQNHCLLSARGHTTVTMGSIPGAVHSLCRLANISDTGCASVFRERGRRERDTYFVGSVRNN
jgi:hypothetical protein